MSVIKIAKEIKPGWINKKQLCASLGISPQAFEKWRVQPIARVGRSVYFTVQDVIANRVNNEVDKYQPGPLDEDEERLAGIDLERYRLTKAQADSQELKNEIAQGEVVPAEFATFTLSRVAAEAAGVLDSLPLQITRKHPELTNHQIENIKRELAKGMNALSRLDELLPDLLDEFIEEAAK